MPLRALTSLRCCEFVFAWVAWPLLRFCTVISLLFDEPASSSRRSRLWSRASRVLAGSRARLVPLIRSSRDWLDRHPRGVRAASIVALLSVAFGGWFVYDVVTDLPDRDELGALGDMTHATTLYDAHGHLIFTIPTEHRIDVPLARISEHLKRAIVAVEDLRFYQHDGLDGVRILGAVWTDLRERRVAEGASTITQQLARMSFLTRDKTLRRKVREAILAERIEKLYSKDEILAFYLNKVYFGDGLYGAKAAARGYFGKPAADLTVAEGALLAGLVKAPSALNPNVDRAAAIKRRDLVLKLMLEEDLIDRAAYDAGISAAVTLRDSLRPRDRYGAYFKEQVRRELIDRFGRDKVYEGRLKVYTTIDPAMQRMAEQAVATSLREIEARGARSRRVTRRGKVTIPESAEDRLQAALVALDPATGEVRAIVGGREIDGVGLNRALQSERQPGSAFKPFVYAAALESGYSPASLLDGLDTPIETYRGPWLPEDEHSTAGAMTLRTAIRTSSNRAAVRMLQTVGIGRTLSYARRLGVGTLPSVPSLALGSGEVTLLSMTSAYAAFAQRGIVREPIFIRRVEDQDGTLLFQAKAREERAVSETTAFLMADMLKDVIDAGTGARARSLGFGLPAAGKTGTTNDFTDAWFVGFTPRLVAGVWVGFDQPRTIIPGGFAGRLAVPLWARFMKDATKKDDKGWFQPPAGVVAVQVCRLSGALPVEECRHVASTSRTGETTYRSMVYTEYFTRGTEPRHTCDMHRYPGYPPYPEAEINAVGLEGLATAVGVDPVPASLLRPQMSAPAAPSVSPLPAAPSIPDALPRPVEIIAPPLPRSTEPDDDREEEREEEQPSR